ncbi:Crp/Fnr family transcriptional regulator [Brevundimonas sp. 2R-24]|uniref:Crp/Fnr family transcriptional regulator n=1 Tax=Peiella sedimenti TaxID=3061083 RepID=A0ABT8SLD3_9CAUL|nr:Crp/Fnr family transcriptional regulator [Caulobacteraceae bacterium XZ-24]
MIGNQWIDSLPPADRARLIPELDEVAFERGRMIYDSGQDVDQVWFPTAGVVSLMTILDRDRMVETAAIGPEGLVGVTCGPLNGRASSRAIAQTSGRAGCLKAETFSRAMAESSAIREALARYTEGLFAQVQQVAACNAQHKLDERFARWLLMLQDRAGTPRLELTQESVAEMLGVRRATVSEVESRLEDRDLIRRGRGVVEVLDRKGLERASCACYGAIQRIARELDVAPTAGAA